MLKKKFSWVKKASGQETGTLLDVGAGTGHFAHFMQENGWKVTALEPDEKARKSRFRKTEDKYSTAGRSWPQTYSFL